MTSREHVHVLHVVRTLGKGGGMERNLYRVVRALSAKGIEHSIALLSDWPEIIDFSGLAPVHRVVTAPNDPRLIARLRELIRSLRPTVIHSRNWGAWPDVALARLTLEERPPLIFSYHGSEDPGAIPLKRRLMHQTMAALTTRIFAVSEAARRLLIEGYGLRRPPIDVIPNGVDTEEFQPRGPRGPLGMRRFRVGTAGRLHPIKNIPLLIEATARLVRDGLDLELEVAGDGPHRELLEGLARRSGLADRARFRGHVEDVPRFLGGLDLFVLPSDNEANPNALLEAMASGVPCVATAVGGVLEVLDGGRCGPLVPAGDVRALAEVMSQLAGDALLRERLGHAARRRIVERYSQARMLADYESLYCAPAGADRGRG